MVVVVVISTSPQIVKSLRN